MTSQIVVVLNVIPWSLRRNGPVPYLLAGGPKSSNCFCYLERSDASSSSQADSEMIAAGGNMKSARSKGWQS